MRKLLIVPVVLVVLSAALLTQPVLASTHRTANVVRIEASTSGRITIVFTNLSSLNHNVRIELGESELGGTRTIGQGTTTATVALKRGVYHFYCSVPGHEDAGMSGKLIVT